MRPNCFVSSFVRLFFFLFDSPHRKIVIHGGVDELVIQHGHVDRIPGLQIEQGGAQLYPPTFAWAECRLLRHQITVAFQSSVSNHGKNNIDVLRRNCTTISIKLQTTLYFVITASLDGISLVIVFDVTSGDVRC